MKIPAGYANTIPAGYAEQSDGRKPDSTEATREHALQWADVLMQLLEKEFPFVSVSPTQLAKDDVVIMLSLDPKESWTNNIYENSRYIKLMAWLTDDNTLELLSQSYKLKPKFRKTHFVKPEDIVKKLVLWKRKVEAQ